MTEEFKPKGEDEIREEVVTDLKGDNEEFNEEENSETISRIVERRVKDETMKASLYEQKQKAKAKAEEPKEPEAPKEEKPVETPNVSEEVNKALEKRDLEELELPDDIKEDIKAIAKMKGVSVKQASKDEYIQFKVNDWKEREQSTKASINGKPGSVNVKDLANAKPGDFDCSTPEGVEAFEKYKKTLKD